MSRIPGALALFCAAVLLSSCDDSPEAKAKSPTGPSAAAVPTVSAAQALGAASARAGGSKVCSSYLRERSKLLLQMEKTPGDSTLQRKARSLTAMLTDACN